MRSIFHKVIEVPHQPDTLKRTHPSLLSLRPELANQLSLLRHVIEVKDLSKDQKGTLNNMGRFTVHRVMDKKVIRMTACSHPGKFSSLSKRDQVNLRQLQENIGHLKTQGILTTSHIMEAITWSTQEDPEAHTIKSTTKNQLGQLMLTGDKCNKKITLRGCQANSSPSLESISF